MVPNLFREHRVLVGATLAAVVLTAAMGLTVVPWPGDVAVTRAVQALLPADTGWARWLSSTAGGSRAWALLVLVVLLASLLVNARAGLLAIVSFVGILGLDQGLRWLIFQPRPDPELVQVVGRMSGSSFPSTFALVHGAAFGYLAMLGVARAAGRARVTALLCIGCTPLVAGLAARLVLGAHWPSEMLVSYLLALVWAGWLLMLVPEPRSRRSLPTQPLAEVDDGSS